MAKRKVKKIITVVLSALLGIGLITASVFIFKPKDNKQISPSFYVGNIDTKSGKYIDSDDMIYSDLFECQGLKVEPNFSSNVKYNVYLYRFDESFIKAITDCSEPYTLSEDGMVRYARIVIKPDFNGKSEKDHKIWFWQIYGISKNLKITVSANQSEPLNLAEVSENGNWDGINVEGWKKLVPINVSNISKLALVFDKGLDNVFNNVNYSFGDKEPDNNFTSLSAGDEISSNIIILDVSKEQGNIFISIASDVELRIYEY